jgi:hypothetical protein
VQTLFWYWTTYDYTTDYFYYYSNWGNTLTMVSLWLLAMCHYTESTSSLHELAITLFEITLSMEYVINPLYWTLLYDPRNFNELTWEAYRGPYFNHFFPFVLLNIEWVLNGFHFNYYQTLRHFIVVGCVYFFMNFMGYLHLGKPIYFFLNY